MHSSEDAVLGYLRQALPGASIKTHGAFIVEIRRGENSYEVEFAEEFLRTHSPEEILAKLLEWNLADELLRVEGMELSVSDAGVRLGSTN